MTPEAHRRLVRAAGPVLALATVTAVALGARAALHDDASGGAAARPPSARERSARPPAPPPPPARPPAPPSRAYAVRAGDTLAAVAERHDTTVDELLALNPGIDPVALRVGQRIRLP